LNIWPTTERGESSVSPYLVNITNHVGFHSAEKQKERRTRIESLPAVYHAPLTAEDKTILNQFASETIAKVQEGSLDPLSVVRAFGKKALKAHEKTNCLTEILLPEAEQWAKACNKKGPLAGMPISLKDTASVAGFESCMGYSAYVGKRVKEDSPLVRLLRDAGAVPFVKTNIPITLLSLEASNDVFGTVTNPHNPKFSAGGSTGGEAALLAFGGSRLGIGTDVAGSVRGPAYVS
jgi:Asp-tRNA(Asn)/Glu-tRNA(Gln) amidotransferase A subunit family amidase